MVDALSVMANFRPLGSTFFSQELDFQTGVYHPMIEYDTGELDTKKEFPRLRYIYSGTSEIRAPLSLA